MALLVNLLSNPSFEDGMTNWECPSGSASTAQHLYGSQSALRGGDNFKQILDPSIFVNGHVYYACAWFKNTSSSATAVDTALRTTEWSTIASNTTSVPASSDWTLVSNLFTYSTVTLGNSPFIDLWSNITETSLYVDGAMLIDLTNAAMASATRAWVDTNVGFFENSPTKKLCIGVNGVARKVKKGYVGVSGAARRIKKGYVGVGGVARCCFSKGELSYYGTITNLNEYTESPSGASVGGYAIIAGGKRGSSSYTSVATAYDSALNMLTPTALSSGREFLAATTIGGYALFGGGYRDTVSAVVDAYDSSLTRSTPTALSASRYHLAATTIGGYALFGGGQASSRSAVVDAYDADLTRTTPTALSSARGLLAATIVGSYALFGGGSYDSSVVDAYDLSLVRTTPTALSKARYSLSAAHVGNYALFAGGYNSSDDRSYSVVDAYNQSLVRTIPTSLSAVNHEMGAVSFGDYALFAGGRNYGVTCADAYDTSLVKTTPSALSKYRYGIGTAIIGDYAIFGGGYGSAAYTRLNIAEAYVLS